MKNINSLEDLFAAPPDVILIWSQRQMGMPLSSSTYDRAVTNHPEYFPVEAKLRKLYAEIPESVHADYFAEYFPREAEIMKDQPHRGAGALFFATHPEETREHQAYSDAKKPEREALERELEDKYYGQYAWLKAYREIKQQDK